MHLLPRNILRADVFSTPKPLRTQTMPNRKLKIYSAINAGLLVAALAMTTVHATGQTQDYCATEDVEAKPY